MNRPDLIKVTTRGGFFAAAAAFSIWGILPPFWKTLSRVEVTLVMAHRIAWCAVLCVLALAINRRLGDFIKPLTRLNSIGELALSGVLLGVNWCVFVWAVLTDRVTECSMGYYINPLFNVLLGRVFFGERLRPRQAVAVGLAVSGVAVLTIAQQGLPLVAVVLPTAFGLYGMMRKKSRVEALPALAIESSILTIPALAVMGWYAITTGQSPITDELGSAALLIGAGVVTAVPLFLFGYGVRHQPLTTVGFLQFVAPTSMFVMGVFLYDEPYTIAHQITFAMIWLGVVLFLSDTIRASNRS